MQKVLFAELHYPNSLTGQGHAETLKMKWQVLQSIETPPEMVVKCQQLCQAAGFISDIDYWKVNWLLTSFFFSEFRMDLPLTFYLPIQGNAGMGRTPYGWCLDPPPEGHSMAFPG